MRERTPFGADVLNALPKLKLLLTSGMRNASFDLETAKQRGITVCGTGAVGNPTAGLAIGLMLELTRKIGFENARMKAGERWQITLGEDVEGKTLGILGLGKLGRQVAGIGKALGMKPIAWSTNLTREACEAGRSFLRDQGRTVRNCRCHHHPPRAQRALARPGVARRYRADETDRLPHQHRARADRR